MTTTEFTNEVLKRIPRIPPDRYETILAQFDGASDRPRGTPGRELLKFAGSISAETVERMKQVIEEECEWIDYESWGLPAGHGHRDRLSRVSPRNTSVPFSSGHVE